MNIKKIFIKIVACALSAVAFASGLFAYAALPDLLTEKYDPHNAKIKKLLRAPAEQKKLISKSLEKELKIFRDLGRGHFDVAPDALVKINPIVMAIFLNIINEFFSKHPNIKDAFVQSLLDRGNGKFYITCCDDLSADGCSYIIPSKYINDLDNSELKLNLTYYGKDCDLSKIIRDTIADVGRTLHPPTEKNIKSLIGFIAAHELGHLVEYLYFHQTIFSSADGKDLISTIIEWDRFASMSTAFIDGEVSFEKISQEYPPEVAAAFSEEKAMAAKREYDLRSAELAASIQSIFIRRNPTCPFASTYSKASPDDYFAELFAYSQLNDQTTMTPLGKSMLEWIQSMDSRCSKK